MPGERVGSELGEGMLPGRSLDDEPRAEREELVFIHAVDLLKLKDGVVPT